MLRSLYVCRVWDGMHNKTKRLLDEITDNTEMEIDTSLFQSPVVRNLIMEIVSNLHQGNIMFTDATFLYLYYLDALREPQFSWR